MTASVDKGSASFLSKLYSMGRMVWSAPKKVVDGFSWFSSKKIEFPDTEQGRRLQKALEPESDIDKVAQAWAYASFWTKTTVLSGIPLLFLGLGVALGVTFILPLMSFVIGLSMHGLLVAHHEGRVKRLTALVEEKDALKEGVGETLEFIEGELSEFVQAQKKETMKTAEQLRCDEEALKNAVIVLDSEVREIEKANTQLVDVGETMVRTLEGIDAQRDALDKKSEHLDELVVVVDEAAKTLTNTVEEFTTTRQHFDAVVDELHEAVATLVTPAEDTQIESTETSFIDLNPYEETIHRTKDELKVIDARSIQRQERRIRETDLVIDETVLHEHRETLKRTDGALIQLEQQREELLTRRATHEAATKALVADAAKESIDSQWLDSVNQSLVAQRQWLDSVNQSLAASRERIKGFNEAASYGVEPHDHDEFLCALEGELNERTARRNAQQTRFESTYRFFGMSIDEAGDLLSQEEVAQQIRGPG